MCLYTNYILNYLKRMSYLGIRATFYILSLLNVLFCLIQLNNRPSNVELSLNSNSHLNNFLT